MIVLLLALGIQIGVMVGVLLKLRRVQVVVLKYSGLTAMVAQLYSNISDTGEYKSTIFGRTIDQHEIAFQADLDGDNVIGLNLVSIETNGSYKLATSHNKYHIIDLNNSSVVTSFGNLNGNGGWSTTQVEASVSGGFESILVLILMVEQLHINLVTQVFINQRLHAQ